MTWAGALMQPKKIQAPSPGTCATRTLSEGAWQSVRFFGRSGSQCLMWRVSGAFLRRLGTLWPGRISDRRDRSGERPTAPRSSVPGTPLRRRGQLP